MSRIWVSLAVAMVMSIGCECCWADDVPRHDTSRGWPRAKTVEDFRNLPTATLEIRAELLSDEVALELKRFPNLKKLNLNYPEMGDAGFSAVCEMSGLEELQTTAARRICNEGFKNLPRLKNLRLLSIETHGTLDDTTLALIGQLTNLQELYLFQGGTFSSKGLNLLGKLPKLVSLDLSNCGGIDDDACESISRIRSLQNLELDGCLHVTDAGLEHLCLLSSLESLFACGWHNISDMGLSALAKHTCLVRLIGFEGANLSDASLEILSAMSQLQHLAIGSYASRFTAKGIAKLTSLKSLRELSLDGLRNGCVSDIESLKLLPCLEALRVRQISVTDEYLKMLATFPAICRIELWWLDAAGSLTFTNEGLRHLVELRTLKSLVINGNSTMDDESLKIVSAIPSLETLIVVGASRITGRTLKEFVPAKQLRSLRFVYCGALSELAVLEFRGARPDVNVKYEE